MMDDDDDSDFEEYPEDFVGDEELTDEELTEEEEERLRKGYTTGDPDLDFPEPRDHRRGYTPAQWERIKQLIPRTKWGIHTTNLTDEVGYGKKKNSVIDVIQLTVAWLEVIAGTAGMIGVMWVLWFILIRHPA